jgi:penicillin-binding protein 2
VIIVSVVVLVFRLFQMQILNRTVYDMKSSDNSIKDVELEPLRGLFYDRNFEVLVSNSPAYTVRIIPAYYDNKLDDILEAVLEVDSGYIKKLLHQNRIYSKYLPIKVKREVDFSAISWIEENSEYLTGVDYKIEMQRDYPAGVNVSHSFGYIKEITAGQLEKASEHYILGDYIGYNGIEKTYENDLRGIKGYEYVLVDARRREIGRYKNGADDKLPVKGRDLVLGIDAEAQRVAEEEFKDKLGAVVAIEPTTGEIIAILSAPDFNLEEFSYITPKEFLDQLYTDPSKPLFNRATMSAIPPGSTFKMLSAIAALDMGLITTDYSTTCTGGFTYGRFFKCHGSHGTVNVVHAIEKSCNTFFYKLIYKIGLDNWKEYASKFGFGSKTNLDITEEVKGLIPNENYYKEIYGENWPKSIMASLGIGQGEVSVTPIQLAKYTALIANNGKSFEPHIVKGYLDGTKQFHPYKFKEISTGIDKKVFDVVKEGMFLVVNGHGTATHIKLEDIHIAGKTGTAQNPHGNDHAWFVGFAPYENPKIALAVLVENVGFGGTHAAPIAKKIIEAYLRNIGDNTKTIDETIAVLESTD